MSGITKQFRITVCAHESFRDTWYSFRKLALDKHTSVSQMLKEMIEAEVQAYEKQTV